MKRKNLFNEHGFTLVEALVVIAIMGIASFVLVNAFLGQNRIYKTQTAEINVNADARAALDSVDEATRMANRVIDTYTTYTTDADTLILSVQSYNSANQLIAGTFDTFVFNLDAGNMFVEIFPAVGSSRQARLRKLASNVSGLVFTYNNADYGQVTEVTTDLSLVENAGVQNRSITISSKSRLRNY